MPRARLSLALTITIVGISARAYGRFTIIAVDGDAPPRGTGVFAENLGTPSLSDSGRAAFPSNLRDNGTPSGAGIFRSDGSPGDLTTMILNGDPTPDANGNIGQAQEAGINLNNQDQLFVLVDLDGSLGGAQDDHAIYRTDGSGTLVQIAREGQSVPGDDGVFFAFAPIAVNDTGQAAFEATLNDTPDNSFQAVYRGDGSTTTEIVRTKRTAPGSQLTFQLIDTGRVALNASGQVLFSGTAMNESAQQVVGLFRGDGSSTVKIAQQGETAPGGNGTYLLLSLGVASFNDSGQAAFQTLLLGTSGGQADNQGIFRGDGNETTTIARKGEFVPDQNGRYLDFFSAVPVMNNQGEVLIHATVSGATNGSTEGLFISDGNTGKVVARLNDSAPGGGRFSGFGTYAMNDQEQVAFHANIDLEDGGATNDTFGLFFYDPVDGLIQVARQGQHLGAVGEMGPINFAGASSFPTDALNGINDNGEVAFQAFAGEHTAVAIWSLPNTTTTTSTTTTSTNTTTTTLGNVPDCAQPVTGGGGRRIVAGELALRGQGPTASDCLFILRTAVGSQTCAPVCVCDPNGDDHTTASDALVCLKKAVGQNVALNCPCGATTTTIGQSTTTTVGGPTTTQGGPGK